MKKEDLPAYKQFESNEFVQLKNGKVCGYILDKESIRGKPSYVIILEPNLEYENLSPSSKDIIDRFMVTDFLELSRFNVSNSYVLIVPLDKAFWFAKIDKENMKRMVKSTIKG